MTYDEALTLAFKYKPVDSPPGRPAEWIVKAIQEAFNYGIQQANHNAAQRRYKGWKGMGG